MPDGHVGSPITWAKRYINNSHLENEDRRHVLLWADNFLETISNDPRQQALALNVLCDYADLIAVRSKVKATDPGSELHQHLTAQAARISHGLIKWLRLAALRTEKTKGKTTRNNGDIFSAPRDRKASEILADQPPGLGGEAA